MVILPSCCSVAKSCPTLCNPVNCSTPGFPVFIVFSWSLLKLMSIESVLPSNHLIFCFPHLLLPSVFPSLFQCVSSLPVSGSQSIGASASVLQMNIQGWFPLGLIGLIFLLSRGLLRVFSILPSNWLYLFFPTKNWTCLFFSETSNLTIYWWIWMDIFG